MPRNKSRNPFENYLPAVVIREAIEAADETGAMPPFDTPMLLRALNLDGEEPDGKTLMYRLTGGRPTLTNRFRAFRLCVALWN